MFTESVGKAHKSGHDKWGITLYEDRVRLNVGSIVVCTLHADKIWLALDKGLAGASEETYVDKALWSRTPENDYSAVPSISGCYRPSTGQKHGETWPRIRKMHFALLDSAADKYKRLRKPSQATHSSEFLEYLRDALGQLDIPNPAY